MAVRVTRGSASSVLAAVGSVSLPSMAFVGSSSTGFYGPFANSIALTVSGVAQLYADVVDVRLRSAEHFGWSSGDPTGTAADVVLARVGTGQFSLGSGLNGHSINPGLLFTELLTIAAAATTDSATNIPAGAVVLGVSVRVTTIIPTAATFTVIGATTSTVFQTAPVAVAAGSTDPGTAAGAFYNAAAQKVRITPNLSPGAATGVVRLAVYGYQITPPTS